MGRIRSVKPEFFKHEVLFEAEQAEGLPLRVAFAGLWTCCDREGRFLWRPRALKTDILPYDDVNFERVLDALVAWGFVVKYHADGRDYGVVPGFERHQVVNNRESASKFPSPAQTTQFDERSTRGSRVEDASATRHDPARGEGKGKEKEGKGNRGGDGQQVCEAAFSESKTEREAILSAIGVDPVSGLTGHGGGQLGTQADMAEARLWLLMPGMTLSVICEEIRQIMAVKSDGPPSTFRYFTKAMQRLAGVLVAEPLVPIAGRKPTSHAKPSGHEWKLDAADFNPDGSLRQ